MADRAQKCGMVMSVTTQIIFSHMSDARAPAMDVQMAPQDAGMARSFWLILSPLLIEDDVYCTCTWRHAKSLYDSYKNSNVCADQRRQLARGGKEEKKNPTRAAEISESYQLGHS